MSPDPNALKTSICETNENVDIGSVKNNTSEFQTNTIAATTTGLGNGNNLGEQIMSPIGVSNVGAENIVASIKPISLNVGRERRNVSSPSVNLQEAFIDPQSPSSSSSTSQATSANDATFEPTIEMMVNDFDDEQTLNEEEALAALESQDPDEEINTLKEESEMPLEELLAKYSALPPQPYVVEPSRKKSKKSTGHKKKHKSKQKSHEVRTINDNDEIAEESQIAKANASNLSASPKHARANLDLNVVVSGDERDLTDDKKMEDCDEEMANSSNLSPRKSMTPPLLEEESKLEDVDNVAGLVHGGEMHKVRRSHLLDLYPEGTFDNVVAVNDAIAGNSKDIPLETLYGVEDDDDEDEEIEEEDEDYKKKVMIGSSYQATIPIGLSQYGDILPYENEDKLIWEPSQVSEREVEEYLLKIRDIKSNQQGEDEEDDVATNNDANNIENRTKENGRNENSNIENLENNSLLANGNKLPMEMATNVEVESTQAVVKDNEQALHLLVQCGYDFKEALRRKRLNALPLNDGMSLWSEEECHKFEEGIQKYGKDFLKIRQNQVRTRTMRELVQFYYLWKKSERRDHNFANADTVDHMDIYLNEDNEYGSNPASISTPLGSPVATNCTANRRNSNASQKNISIMTTTTTSTSNNSTNNSTNLTAATNSTTCEKNISNTTGQQHQHHNNKRRNHSNTNDFNHETSVNALTNSTK